MSSKKVKPEPHTPTRKGNKSNDQQEEEQQQQETREKSTKSEGDTSAKDTKDEADNSATVKKDESIKSEDGAGAGADVEENDDICEICFSGDIEDDNLIVYCDGTGADGEPCKTVVHQYCYGAFTIPEGDEPWYCDMCAVKRGLKKVHPNLKKTVDKCLLCPSLTGAFKPLHDNSGWCHATCAVWIPETGFFNPAKMESIIGYDAIEKSRFKLVCELCHIKEGACVQCMAHACRYSFHPRCGGEHRNVDITMEMEAVSVGQSFDVLKLVYCPKHRYLGNDPMEKKILIRKWKMTGSLEDGSEEEEAQPTSTRKRKLIKPKRGRRKNPDGSTDEEDEEDEDEDEADHSSAPRRSLTSSNGGNSGSGGMALDDRPVLEADFGSSDSSDSDSIAEYTEDEDGRQVRKMKAYMCADCGSMKRSHKCPYGNKKRRTSSASLHKRRKLSSSTSSSSFSSNQLPPALPIPPGDQPVVVIQEHAHLFFPCTSTLERHRWRADETDSDCDSVMIHEDELLNSLVASAFEQERQHRDAYDRYEAERLARSMPKLKTNPLMSHRAPKSTASGTPAKPKTPKPRPVPISEPSLIPETRFAHLDPSRLTPEAIEALMKETRARIEAAAAAASASASASASVAPSQNGSVTTENGVNDQTTGTTFTAATTPYIAHGIPSTVENKSPPPAAIALDPQALPFQQLLQTHYLQQMIAFAQQQQQQQQSAVAAAATTATAPTSNDASSTADGSATATAQPAIPPTPTSSPFDSTLPNFLTSPQLYQSMLESFIAQQRDAEQRRILAYQQHLHAQLEAEADRARLKAELKSRTREERQLAKEKERAEREKQRADEKAAKLEARKQQLQQMAVLKSQQQSMKKLNKKTASSSSPSSSIDKSSQPHQPLIFLTPAEEIILKQRLLKLTTASSARDKLTCLTSFLDTPFNESKPFALRLLQEYRGLDLLRRWIESAIVVIQGADAMAKSKGEKSTTTTSIPTPNPTSSSSSSQTLNGASNSAADIAATQDTATSSNEVGLTSSASASASAATSSSLSSPSTSSADVPTSHAIDRSSASGSESVSSLISSSTSMTSSTPSRTATTAAAAFFPSLSSTSSAAASSSSLSSSSLTPLTPLLLNTELVLACLRTIERLAELADLTRQASFPQLYTILLKLSQSDQSLSRFKELATKLKSKFPNPYSSVGSTPTRTTIPKKLVQPNSNSNPSLSINLPGAGTGVHGPTPLGRQYGFAGPTALRGLGPTPLPNPMRMAQQQAQQNAFMQATHTTTAAAAGMQARQAAQQYMQQQQQNPRDQRKNPYQPTPSPHLQQQQQQQQQSSYQYGGYNNRPNAPQAYQYSQSHHHQQQQQQQQQQHHPYYQQHHHPQQHQSQQQQQSHPYNAYASHNDPVPLPVQAQAPPYPSTQHHPQQSAYSSYPNENYYHDRTNPPSLSQQSQSSASATVSVPPSVAPTTMNALSALSAMLNTPTTSDTPPSQSESGPASTPAIGAGASSVSSGLDVSQLSQWLSAKLDGSKSDSVTGGNESTSAQLAALLAKVQPANMNTSAQAQYHQATILSQSHQSPTSYASSSTSASSSASASDTLSHELNELHHHLRHWDDQYRTLWGEHNSTLHSIMMIQNLPSVVDKLQRMGELHQLESRAQQLADQLRKVQANQAKVNQRIQFIQQQQQQHQYQQQQQHQHQLDHGDPRRTSSHVMSDQVNDPTTTTSSTKSDPRTFILYGLSPSTSESSIQQLLNHFGQLISCQLVIQPATGMSAQYAHCTYRHIEETQRVMSMANSNQLQLDGRRLQVRLATNSTSISQTRG